MGRRRKANRTCRIKQRVTGSHRPGAGYRKRAKESFTLLRIQEWLFQSKVIDL